MCSLDMEKCPVWRETPRVGRKPHQCDCCSRHIRKGEAHIEHASAFGGRMQGERLCFGCWWARTSAVEQHGPGEQLTPSPSYAWEWLTTCADDGASYRQELAILKWNRRRAASERRESVAP